MRSNQNVTSHCQEAGDLGGDSDISFPLACVRAQLLRLSFSFQPHGLQTSGLLCPWGFPGKNTGVGCHALLQGIFPTQRSDHCHIHTYIYNM